MKCLRIKDWNERFESAKSRTYKIKSQTYMPNKQGLGYTRLMRMHDGAALYGAWCAVVNLLSRMESPRQGYLTDSGKDTGLPLSAADINHLTMIPEPIAAKMLEICSSEHIGWFEVTTIKDSAVSLPRIADGPSPLPLPSPLPSPEDKKEEALTAPAPKQKFQKPTPAQVEEYAKTIGFDGIDANQFCDFYEAKGWMIGKSPMRSWQAAVRTWKKRRNEFQQVQPSAAPKTTTPREVPNFARRQAAETELKRLQAKNYHTNDESSLMVKLRGIIQECNRADLGL